MRFQVGDVVCTPTKTFIIGSLISSSPSCAVSFSDVPATVNLGSSFNAKITQGPTNVDWGYVSLYMDGARLQGGAATPPNSYSWNVPAITAGSHTLTFKTHDYTGYGVASGPNPNVSCTPTASFTTNGAVSTPTPTTTIPTSADVNKNGCTDINDFNDWLYAYQHNGIPSSATFMPDLNGDGKVDLLDYNIWYKVTTAGTNVCR